VQKKEILKFKKEFQNIMHQRDENVWDMDKIQATYKINPKVITRCEKDNYSCELNHNYGAISFQAHIGV
jgi:hypothetical protein